MHSLHEHTSEGTALVLGKWPDQLPTGCLQIMRPACAADLWHKGPWALLPARLNGEPLGRNSTSTRGQYTPAVYLCPALG